MNFAVELLTYHKLENKHLIGSKPGGMQLIEMGGAANLVGVAAYFVGILVVCTWYISLQKLIHDFLFPTSKLVVESRMKKVSLSIADNPLTYYMVNIC